MPKYTTTRFVRHDGKPYPAGSQVEMNAQQAEPLIARGALVDPKRGDKHVQESKQGEGETKQQEGNG